MDPILFKIQLLPLKQHKYDLEKILNICYPLRGLWDWSWVLGGKLDEQQEHVFKVVHTFPEHNSFNQRPKDSWYIIDTQNINDLGEDMTLYEKDTRFFVAAKCLDDHEVYKSLLEFLPEPDSESEESLVWPEETCDESEQPQQDKTSPEKVIPAKLVRDDNWKFKNPAFNPRLISDIENDYLEPPNGFTKEEIVEFIGKIVKLGLDEYITTDGEIVEGGARDNIQEEFGIVSRSNCLKSVKCLLFFKKVQSSYSLDMDVSEYVESAEKRKMRWAWHRIGNGHYRDFNWMFLGNQDMITKTIFCLESLGYKQEVYKVDSKDKGYYEFDDILTTLWKLSPRKCLNLDTGEEELKTDVEWYDEWGWTCNDIPSEDTIRKNRAHIFTKFMERHPTEKLLGKKDSWTQKFLQALNKETIIEFSKEMTPIKYTASASQLYHFSKLGFALKKDEKNWTVEQIERAIKKYKKK